MALEMAAVALTPFLLFFLFNVISFKFLQVLFNQFKYFYNLYFLLLACSQFIKELRLGALYTYWVPLVCIHLIVFAPPSLISIITAVWHVLPSIHLCQLCIHTHKCHSTDTEPLFWSPQGFVLIITIIREAVEEIRCYVRDKEVNSQIYSKLSARGKDYVSGALPKKICQ